MNMKSSINKSNNNSNLSKFSFLKYTQLKLNNKASKGNNNKNRAKTSKPSPLKNNNKYYINNYIITNYNDFNNTPKLILNTKHKEGNIIKTNSKDNNNNNCKTKQKVNYNEIKGNNNIFYLNSIHNTILRKKKKKINHKNKITNIKKIKNNENNIFSTEGNSSLLNSTKTSQIGLKYINNIMKKINIDNHRANYYTVKQSKKNSKEKRNNNNSKKSSSNNSKNSTSKIKNIIINNNYKNLLSKYSIISLLTTQTNKNSKKKLNNNSTNSQLSKSYGYNKFTLETNSNKSKIKKKEKNNFLENKTTYKKIINNCYYENLNLNIIYNLFPMSSTQISGKNKIKKKLTPKIKKLNISKIKSNSANESKNKINKEKEKKLNLNNNKIKNYTVNTKIINELSSKIKNLFISKKENIFLSKNQTSNFCLTKTSSKKKSNSQKKVKKPFLTYSRTIEKKVEKKRRKEDKNLEKQKDSSSNSFSLIKDNIYYKKESKNIKEYIEKYYKEKKEYPKTKITFYKIGRSIGHGAFGKVNIGLHILSGHIVAIKSFNKKENKFPRRKIQNEINIMKKLRNHKNIIKLFEYFETEKYICIIMENIPGGSLLNIINKMSKIPESYSKYIFKQIIEGLIYIHENGIVHLDIKPDNILIDLSNQIKICDFGVGKQIKQNQLLKDSCGTPAFVAPEILLNSPYDPFKCDIWSCGVLLYSMITGFVPFRGNNDYELHKNIISGNFQKIHFATFECNDLIQKLLNVNPNQRILLSDILKHNWFNEKINLFSVSLFTNAEKIIYYKMNINYTKGKIDDLCENFSYKYLESEFEDENKNVGTTSFIITPYNSRINYFDTVYYEDLKIEDHIMKFVNKVNDLNREYEIKNNEDVDQGFIINQKEKKVNNKIMISFNEEFENKNYNNGNKDNNEIKEKKEGESFKKNEDNYSGDEKNEKNEKKLENNNFSTNSNNFHIDENAVKYVENFGFNRDYIIKSLENNDLNHATATYYLKLTLQNE